MLSKYAIEIIKQEYEDILEIDKITHDRNTTLTIYQKMRVDIK